jgi:predicted DNA-binding transcriptional regulator AlpA
MRIAKALMAEYEFTLKFALLNPAENPESYLDALFEAGCDDALVGTAQHGSIGLDFSRSARNAQAAVASAIRGVQKAIPEARLIEASPDMVGIAEIAVFLGCSRQNTRKVISSHQAGFPLPIHTGGHASIWRLSEVLDWAATRKKKVAVENLEQLREVAFASAITNVNLQAAGYKAAKKPHRLPKKGSRTVKTRAGRISRSA